MGKVQDITLTDDGQAKVEIKIDDDKYALRRGTKAVVRASSLSGIANRYIDLQLRRAPPRRSRTGATITQKDTTTAVDLDEIFNVFDPQTRHGPPRRHPGIRHDHLLGACTKEANGRNRLPQSLPRGVQPPLPRAALRQAAAAEVHRQSANLVTDINERHTDLTGLISNLNATTSAIGNQRDALAEAIPACQRSCAGPTRRS